MSGRMIRGLSVGLVLVLGLALAGVWAADAPSDGMASGEHSMKSMETGIAGVAVMHPTKGNHVMGVVHFTKTGPDEIRVDVHITGLEPGTTHGFHIHEWGDCTADDGTSTGGHYDPEGTHHHGKPDGMGSAPHHAGDMGNITADDKGVAETTITIHGVTINGMKDPIVGRGVIIHAKADDFGQPTGNAGGRIACGVIGLTKAK